MIETQKAAPKVSILIPVYNRETLIGDCVQSALDQTFPDFEIIIVDNASTDKTWEICQQYANKDERVRIFRNETNIGPVRNWLRCVNEARGEFGKILFSDDLIFPRFLEQTLPYLEDVEVGFVSTAAIIGETPDRGELHYVLGGEQPRMLATRYWGQLLRARVPYSPGAGVFRMSDIRENLLDSIPTSVRRDFTRNGAGPDVLLYALTALKYKYVVMLPAPEVFFRAHPGSISMLNADNEVVRGYYAAMAWFFRKKLARRYWARYVARTWLLDMRSSRKLKSVRKQCVAYEGSGALGEIVGVLGYALLESFEFVSRQIARRI